LAYLVLARRYRPQSFEQLVGQDYIVTTLTNALKSGRIHHAFLFTGARGTGKTSTARLLAKALNCENGPTAEICNNCIHCTDITDGKEVDVLEIDGATNTGVENVRALREDIRFLPSSARYRIIIIDEVHMLTTSAFNALLKTLEEPPPHVIFIFATTEPHKIPATILSRVQRFDFKRVNFVTLEKHIKFILDEEGFQYENGAVRIITNEGEGSVRDTLSILDQILAHHVEGIITEKIVMMVLGLTDKTALYNISNAILDRDGSLVLESINNIFFQGYDLLNFIKSLTSFFRDLIVIKSCKDSKNLINLPENQLSQMENICKDLPIETIHLIFSKLFASIDIVGRALSPKIALEMVLMDLVISEPLLPIASLMNQLSNLENSTKNLNPEPGLLFNKTKNSSIPDISNYKKKSKKIVTPVIPISSQNNKVSENHLKKPIEFQLKEKYDRKEWIFLLQSFKKLIPTIGNCLENGRFLSGEKIGSKVIFSLVFAKGQNDYCISEIKNSTKVINNTLAKISGHPIEIQITLDDINNLPPIWDTLPQGVPHASLRELKQRKAAVIKEKINEEVKLDPVIQTFISKLNSQIIDIKPNTKYPIN
jgi:DNA polymerase III subunit gamma/tau